ncbi:hypothetical protein JDV02_003267 [Purpureocillium takamizusanense]|uniref:HAUS augmin-like complex subunit 6 N-terminal domain-containing protein n=1 Tax=Purpureocillium takamizusanense TaxID=2060973 RepID=A0A9Q8QC36_9HYPO|nr:uncharacterized protein JDV02_003267 [Purpureocillium takamizusanense]UNI16870.1 hypothetical protein JDV02_003267 [Purpureocillium takamizusanense]
MAAVQRTRPPAAPSSSRVPANSSRPLQHRVQAPSVAASSSARSSQAPSSSLSSSSVTLFLTNLRLLDLDLLPDWPGITTETFATTGSSVQGQKRRIHCVEWALFRLFSLWDPDEAANKLKPFFPPLDQIQSLNLRAALLRALENVKKNGVLGRDSVIRKTMLDECKGERLEEVLAVFSTAVLKLATANEVEAGRAFPAAALEMAIQERGYSTDTTQLRMLSLVHKAHIRHLLQRKNAARSQYSDFADLLGVKERGLARRNEILLAKQKRGADDETALSDTTLEEMRRIVRGNWTGNEKWMSTLLLGDAGAGPKSGSDLFAMPMDRIWRRVEQGRLSEIEKDDGGLLDQLDGRVNALRERLGRWQDLRASTTGHQEGQPPTASPSKRRAQSDKRKATKGIDLHFERHQRVQVGDPESIRGANNIIKGEQPILDEHRDIVDSLRDELKRIRDNTNGAKVTSFLARPRLAPSHPNDEEGEEEEVSEMSELDDEIGEVTSTRAEPPIAKRVPVRPHFSGDHNPSHATTNAASKQLEPPIKSLHDLLDHDEEPMDASRRRSLWDSSPPSSPSPSKRSPTRRVMESNSGQRVEPAAVHGPSAANAPDQEPPRSVPSPTQQLADRILESMNKASPSPTKRAKPRHTLSLAQRTRLSMARTSPFLDGEADDLAPAPSSNSNPAAGPASLGPAHGTKKPSPPIPEADEPSQDRELGNEDDLVARTRRSMAGLEKAKQKAQIERRRSLRRSKLPPPRRDGSLFPKLSEEPEGGDDTIALAEELMGEEDMEAVFRSRPKIKASPMGSPTKMDDEWP